MTDEINEPEPPKQESIEAEVIPNEPKQEKDENPARRPSVLSTLPPELLEEVNTRLQSGEKITAIREDMIQKYPNVKQLKIGYQSWVNHFKKLTGGTSKELKDGTIVKKEMVAALPSADDLQKVVSQVINPEISIENKKEALAALFNKATERLKILENRQKNYIDPDIEALIGGYMKEQRALLETVTKLQEVLQKDVLAQMRGELSEYTRVILTTVYQSHNLTYTGKENKFDLFRITLEEHLEQTLKAYSATQKPL